MDELLDAPESGKTGREMRLWPSLLSLAILQILSAALITAVAAACTWMALGRCQQLSLPAVQDWIQRNGATAFGFYVMVVPVHLITLALALAGGVLSREALPERLGLTRPAAGAGALSLFVLAAIGAQILGVALADLLFGGPGQQFQAVSRLLQAVQGWDFMAVSVLATVGAGAAQEVFFRGYVLRGIARRWRPSLAISATAIAFALHHGSLYYAVIALVPAIWFGILASKTGSVWPPVLCHVSINAVFLAWLRLAEPNLAVPLMDWRGPLPWIGLLGLAALVASARILRTIRPARPVFMRFS